MKKLYLANPYGFSEQMLSKQEALAIANSQFDRNPALIYLANLTSRRSQEVQQSSLQRVAEILSNGQASYLELPWSALRYPQLVLLRSLLSELYEPKTVNRMLAAVRGVLREAWNLEQIPTTDYYRAKQIANIKDSTLPVGRSLPIEEIQGLLAICEEEDTSKGLRDAALIALLTAGPRRAEVVNLELDHFCRSTGKIRIEKGKGRKTRFTYLPLSMIDRVKRWIDECRGEVPGTILLPIHRSGSVVYRGKGINPQTVRDVLCDRTEQLNRRRKEQGLNAIAALSPHDFRRTFISDLMEAGVDITRISQLVGHADPRTTARYDRRGEEEKLAAVRKLKY